MIPTEKTSTTADFISKTQKKREMNARQALGETLVGVSRQRLQTLNLPEKLLDAILEAEKIKSHGARLRQMQYIGKLMREVDPEPIQAQLAKWANPTADPIDQLAEKWRNRLLTNPEEINTLIAQYPGLSRKGILRLVTTAKTERTKKLAPKAFRHLFQQLRKAISAHAPLSDEKDANEM